MEEFKRSPACHSGEMEQPKFIEEGYMYFDEDRKMRIKDDSPDWVKDDFDKFMNLTDPEQDENGIITQY